MRKCLRWVDDFSVDRCVYRVVNLADAIQIAAGIWRRESVGVWLRVGMLIQRRWVSFRLVLRLLLLLDVHDLQAGSWHLVNSCTVTWCAAPTVICCVDGAGGGRHTDVLAAILGLVLVAQDVVDAAWGELLLVALVAPVFGRIGRLADVYNEISLRAYTLSFEGTCLDLRVSLTFISEAGSRLIPWQPLCRSFWLVLLREDGTHALALPRPSLRLRHARHSDRCESSPHSSLCAHHYRATCMRNCPWEGTRSGQAVDSVTWLVICDQLRLMWTLCWSWKSIASQYTLSEYLVLLSPNYMRYSILLWTICFFLLGLRRV